MRNRLSFALVALLATGCLAVPSRGADITSILGIWLAKADTPNGPVEVELDLKKEGDNLVGTAALFQGTLPLSAIKWEDPQLAVQFDMGGMVFKMLGTLKEGKFSGTWEQVAGDMKGTWTAERKGAPAGVPAAAVSGVAGSWALVANTPQGDMQFTLDAKPDGEKVNGSLSSDMGSIEIQSGSFKGDQLQFDVNVGGQVYHIDAKVTGDRLSGKWGPPGGGEGGALSGSRKSSGTAAATPAVSAPSIEGVWNCVASSPQGELPIELNVKSDGEKVTGTAGSADGNIQIENGKFSGGKLVFEVEYMGGKYRIEAAVDNAQLKGKWSEVGGSETGAFTGKRKS